MLFQYLDPFFHLKRVEIKNKIIRTGYVIANSAALHQNPLVVVPDGFPAPFAPSPHDSRTSDTADSSQSTVHTDFDRPGFALDIPTTECSPRGKGSIQGLGLAVLVADALAS